jgi:hypothetical protein
MPTTKTLGETNMLANVLLMALYAFLAFWALEAVYVLWQAHRNDALPRFWSDRKPKLVR